MVIFIRLVENQKMLARICYVESSKKEYENVYIIQFTQGKAFIFPP